MVNKLIDISNLCVSYENKPNVLTNVSLTIYEDDFLGIIGSNGGGKTTLLKTILGLIKPQSGTVSFFDNGLKVPSINIGYLPQINRIDKRFPISVSEVILSGLTSSGSFFKKYSSANKQNVALVLEQLNIQDIAHRAIGDLSGGQLQRVLLGRAIIDNPKLIMLDEPSSFIDKLFEKDFYKLLSEINRRIAVAIVSHDVRTVLSVAKNIACVNRQLHYHSGTDISEECLLQTYERV